MKHASFTQRTVSKKAAGVFGNAKPLVLLLLLLSVLLTGCLGASVTITSAGNDSTIKVENAEDGKTAESGTFTVGKGETVSIVSSLDKGQLKIEFAEADVMRDENDLEQVRIGDVAAVETVGAGDSRTLSLEPGTYVMQLTVIGETNGKVTVDIK